MAKHIKITKHFNAYNPGETAMFDDDVADQIVKREFGVEVKVDKNGAVAADKTPDQK
jgi:hypothetical protein